MGRKITVGSLLLLLLIAPPGHALEVHDDLGREVSMPRAAERIVTLSPHATELVLAAGAERQLVGIAAGGLIPDTLDTLPRVGGRGGLDREALMALRPDLVIAWHSGNRATDLDWIDSTGIALYRSEPAALQDIAKTIRDIGTLGGIKPSAQTGARAFERALLTPCIQLPPKPAYVIVWDRPAMTVGGRHWINAVLTAAGYRNVLEHIDRGVFHIAPEAVLGYSELDQISLKRSFEHGEADRLADLLSRPGPSLGGAIQMLCARRLRYSPDRLN
ncbi:MAG: ABC transporter substrate-binding protein [Gammaproteobacteria bacterium]|nr:ABC transporter substrate-binding protein [Gammaproteobacteria bacterium]